MSNLTEICPLRAAVILLDRRTDTTAVSATICTCIKTPHSLWGTSWMFSLSRRLVYNNPTVKELEDWFDTNTGTHCVISFILVFGKRKEWLHCGYQQPANSVTKGRPTLNSHRRSHPVAHELCECFLNIVMVQYAQRQLNSPIWRHINNAFPIVILHWRH